MFTVLSIVNDISVDPTISCVVLEKAVWLRKAAIFTVFQGLLIHIDLARRNHLGLARAPCQARQPPAVRSDHDASRAG